MGRRLPLDALRQDLGIRKADYRLDFNDLDMWKFMSAAGGTGGLPPYEHHAVLYGAGAGGLTTPEYAPALRSGSHTVDRHLHLHLHLYCSTPVRVDKHTR